MPDFERGGLQVHGDGSVLGGQLVDLEQHRQREVGVLTAEQLRAVELRLVKRFEMAIEILGQSVSGQFRETAATQAALMALVEQRAATLERATLDQIQVAQDRLLGRIVQSQGALEQWTLSQFIAADERIQSAMQQQAGLVEEAIAAVQTLRLEIESRTVRGRLRRLRAWLGQQFQRMRS